MTLYRIVLRSLVFHARAHLGTLLGTAVATSVLVGALVVGDSVRASLRRVAELRLGRVSAALASGDRLFRAELFGYGPGYLTYVQAGAGMPPQPLAAITALELPAVAVSADGSARANGVTLRGVDARFWQFAPKPTPGMEIPADEAVLNEALARQLRVQPGDEVLFRVEKPAALSRDVPIAPEEGGTVAVRIRVHGIVPEDQMGRFSLLANSIPPYNAFVSISFLQARVGAPGRANLVLAGTVPLATATSPQPASTVTWVATPGLATNVIETLDRTLRERWRLEDAALELREVPGAASLELRTRRVFLDSAVGESIAGILAGTNAARLPGLGVRGLLTYFVNELRLGDQSTPYSMVTACGPPLIPADLRDDEIMIGQWLADDLGARPGDELALKYYAVGVARQLEEHTARFRVRGVYPVGAPGVDRTLAPEFPGLSGAKSCREWDTGLPIQADRIRPKDEAYWEEHRGTPKALVTLAAGQRLWGNRFGNLTALRFDIPGQAARPEVRTGGQRPPGAPAVAQGVRTPSTAGALAGLNALLIQSLDPALFGLSFRPVRPEALAAVEEGQDFGQLFLGFSFFLIVAALILVGLLFRFSLEQRAVEVGALRALGFGVGLVRAVLLCEGGGVAVVGGIVGALGGLGYAAAMLYGLNTVWNDAVGGAQLSLYTGGAALWLGPLAAVCVTLATMGLVLRRLAALPPRLLLSGSAEIERALDAGSINALNRTGNRWAKPLALAAVFLAVVMVVWGLRRGGTGAAGLFFGSGALLLMGGWAMASLAMSHLGEDGMRRQLTAGVLALRGVGRRRRRSASVIGLLGCGSFLIAAIGVFRLDAERDASGRSSGTGGFALFGQSSQPVVQDLDSAAGRELLGVDASEPGRVSVVPFRVREGDDASCLNLNRAQRPQLLGVRPDRLAERGAFRFVQVVSGRSAADGWRLLEMPLGPDEVPGVADEATIRWALGRRVGDRLEFEDDRGRPFGVRLVAALANSVLQGNVIVAEGAFVNRFPTVTGHRVFLVDAPSSEAEAVAASVTRALQDSGVEVSAAAERLAAFNAVQNTYLSTFQALGGLGLLLGSAGLGVLVLRNVLERRGEFAVMLAVGWRRRKLRELVLVEHGVLLLAGLALGVVAAAVAVLPAVVGRGAEMPLRSLGATLLGVWVNGCLWTWLATRMALSGRLIDTLRND